MEIRNINRIYEKVSNWKFNFISHIKAFEYNLDEFTINFYAQKRNSSIWPKEINDYEVKIKFNNVVNLNLKIQRSLPVQIMGFDIIDISKNQMEGINFQIEDYENGIIEFYCEDIEILNFIILSQPII